MEIPFWRFNDVLLFFDKTAPFYWQGCYCITQILGKWNCIEVDVPQTMSGGTQHWSASVCTSVRPFVRSEVSGHYLEKVSFNRHLRFMSILQFFCLLNLKLCTCAYWASSHQIFDFRTMAKFDPHGLKWVKYVVMALTEKVFIEWTSNLARVLVGWILRNDLVFDSVAKYLYPLVGKNDKLTWGGCMSLVLGQSVGAMLSLMPGYNYAFSLSVSNKHFVLLTGHYFYLMVTLRFG